MVASELTDEKSQRSAHHPSTASKYLFKLAHLWPPRVCPNSLDYGHQVPLQIVSVSITECISTNSLDDILQGYHPTCSKRAIKCIYTLAPSRSWSATLSSLDHGIQVYLQIRSNAAPKCIPKLTPLWTRSESLSSLKRQFQRHLELLSTTACCQFRHAVCRWAAI
jgi:hypothetical protein